MAWNAAVPVFRKSTRTDCSNHREISSVPMVTKILASIVLHCLKPARETNIREEQAGFRSGQSYIGQISTLQQLL